MEPMWRAHHLQDKVPSLGLYILDACLGQADPISRTHLCLDHLGYTACFSELACALDDSNLLDGWTLACHCPGWGGRVSGPFHFHSHKEQSAVMCPCFPGIAFPWHPNAFPLFWLTQKNRFGKELRIPFAAWNHTFQVRVPGLGELGVVCLLAAQWVCTSPPFGYLTNTGSPKGFWQSWQSFFSESRTALPFSFICKQKATVRRWPRQGRCTFCCGR